MKNNTELILCLNQRKENFLITIVIPTFDRPDNLVDLILFLEKNITKKTKIVVFDNKSNNPINIHFLKMHVRKSYLKIYRNKYFVSPEANLLKAIEYPDTPWVWPLGDSKILDQEQVKRLEKDCENHSNAMGIIYSHKSSINEKYIDDINSLNVKGINLGDLFLVGNSLISTKSVKKYFSYCTLASLSQIPQVLFHLLPLSNNEKIYLSNKNLIKGFKKKPNSYNPELSLLECWGQFSLILTMQFKIKELKILNKKIVEIENFKSRYNFLKFCLIKILREKVDISPHLLRILKYRYLFFNKIFERVIVYLLYFFSLFFFTLIKLKSK